jgi:hypothetical protein
MSKLHHSLLAGALVLASAVAAFAADSDYTTQGEVKVKNGAPQIENFSQVRPNARRFYSYNPSPTRGKKPVMIQTFTRPASAKALGDY